MDQKLPADTQNLIFRDVEAEVEDVEAEIEALEMGLFLEAVAAKKDHFHENRSVLRLSA